VWGTLYRDELTYTGGWENDIYSGKGKLTFKEEVGIRVDSRRVGLMEKDNNSSIMETNIKEDTVLENIRVMVSSYGAMGMCIVGNISKEKDMVLGC